MSHLLNQIADDKKAKTPTGAPMTPSAPATEKNSVKGNLTMAVEIVQNCFNIDAPKSVQKIGLFSLQQLLPHFKILYPLYVEVLVHADEEIKEIILSETPIKPGEEIFYSIGDGSFNYKLQSDLSHFDEYQMASALIDIIVNQGYDSLLKEHMQIFMLACGVNPEGTINNS